MNGPTRGCVEVENKKRVCKYLFFQQLFKRNWQKCGSASTKMTLWEKIQDSVAHCLLQTHAVPCDASPLRAKRMTCQIPSLLGAVIHNCRRNIDCSIDKWAFPKRANEKNILFCGLRERQKLFFANSAWIWFDFSFSFEQALLRRWWSSLWNLWRKKVRLPGHMLLRPGQDVVAAEAHKKLWFCCRGKRAWKAGSFPPTLFFHYAIMHSVSFLVYNQLLIAFSFTLFSCTFSVFLR